MTEVLVRLFASVREAAGCETLLVPVASGATVAELRELLCARLPACAPLLARSMIAVNQSYADPTTPVCAGDEVAVIPPVSGGAPRVRVSDAPIDLSGLVELVSSPQVGAVTTFLGLVRDHNLGREVTHLEYEGYAPMAEKELDAICEEACSRWQGARVAVAHRTGRLEIGEASVGIAVGAAHRAEAFEACRHVIEELKRRVPVWKKEHFEGGAVWLETPEDRERGTPPAGLDDPPAGGR